MVYKIGRCTTTKQYNGSICVRSTTYYSIRFTPHTVVEYSATSICRISIKRNKYNAYVYKNPSSQALVDYENLHAVLI